MSTGPEESPQATPPTPRVLVWLSQAWLIVGVTLALFLVLEFGYRGQAAIRSALRGSHVASLDSTLHPYADSGWWAAYQREDAARRWRLDPYRGFWPLPQDGRHINIDSAGHRVTPQPTAAAPVRRVRFFGGSAMWGVAARDSFTIPALVARGLHERGLTDVVVENRAQPGFTMTQSLATLSLDLARGDVPHAAVFLDGFNETMTARVFGEPGHTYTEAYAQRLVDRGRRSGWQQVLALGEYSALVRRLRAVIVPGRGLRERPDPEVICGPVAGYYRGVTEVVAALGREYGFTPLYLQQAVHASSDKPLSRWEAQLPERPIIRRCDAAIDSAMAPAAAGGSYLSLAGLFDGDSGSVFVDAESHVTEDANRRIADVIADRLVTMLEPPR